MDINILEMQKKMSNKTKIIEKIIWIMYIPF